MNRVARLRICTGTQTFAGAGLVDMIGLVLGVSGCGTRLVGRDTR